MNISENTIQQLESEGFNIAFYKGDSFNESEPIEADHILLSRWDNPGDNILESIKTPKKKEVTTDWIMNKINKESTFINLSKHVKNIIKDSSVSIYPASYGIGVFAIFGRKIDVQNIEEILQKHNIEFYTEFSEARWVFRFKISKSKENLERIKSI